MAYQFLILDSRGNAVAHGTSQQVPQGTQWQMVIDKGDMAELVKHTNFRLVCNSDVVPALEGRLVRWRGNVVVLEPVCQLEESLRENLRIPVRFSSYIYPKSGTWKGREEVISRNLSCGGVAFYCQRSLGIGERVQIVIPVTTSPLLVEVEVLRGQTQGKEPAWYAGRFVDLVHEQESMIREAVFSLQLKGNA